jgi:phosphate transport system protein
MSALGGHIVRRFDEELDELKRIVLKMGNIAKTQVEDATQALVEHQVGLAQMVVRRERWLDDLDVQASDLQVNLLLTRQPTGPDLRMVLALGRSVRDLERIGDEAVRVAETALQFDSKSRGYPSRELLVVVATMSNKVLELVESALELIETPSTPRAVDLVKSGSQIVEHFGSGLRSAVTFVLEEPRNVGVVVSLALALRSLERVGGHAQNIAEHVIFQRRGEDVRHRDVAEVERTLSGSGPLSEASPPLYED